MPRTTVPDNPILSRIAYLIEHLYAGDVTQFEAHLGYYRRQLEYILRRQAKIPIKLLVTLVTDFGVSAEWLLTGYGPVFAVDEFVPVSKTVASSHVLFNPASMRARSLPVKVPVAQKIQRQSVHKLSAAVFEARVHKAPVVLLFDWPSVLPERRAAIVSLLRDNCVTALATTTRGLYKDVGRQGAKIISVARRAARCGMGFGAAVGRWLALEKQSIFYTTNALHIPISVYYQPGDDYRYFESAKFGPTVGAELGAATQVDLFLLAEQMRLFVTTEHSVCIDTTNHKSMTALLTNVMASAHRTTDTRQGSMFKIDSSLLPCVVQSCHEIFRGKKSANRRDDSLGYH